MNMFQVHDCHYFYPHTRISENTFIKKGHMKTCSEILLHSVEMPIFFQYHTGTILHARTLTTLLHGRHILTAGIVMCCGPSICHIFQS